MRRRRRFTAVILVAAAALVASLTGCTQATSCASWIGFETPQDAYAEAPLVLLGTVSPTGGTRERFGITVADYKVDVQTVYKGEAPNDLIISPTPETCGPGDWEDPLSTDEPVYLFLSRYEGRWSPLTPYNCVVPYTGADDLPFTP